MKNNNVYPSLGKKSLVVALSFACLVSSSVAPLASPYSQQDNVVIELEEASDTIADVAETEAFEDYDQEESTAAEKSHYDEEISEAAPEAIAVSTNGELNENPVQSFVFSFYAGLLGIEPDEQLVSEWSDQLSSRQKAVSDYAIEIVTSKEFQELNLSDYDYVQRIFQACLGRAFSDGEAEVYQNLLNEGFSRFKVLESVIKSSEFKIVCESYGIECGQYRSDDLLDCNVLVTRFVNRLYSVALNRVADNGGRRNWVSALVNGSADASGTAWGFLNSAEYKSLGRSDDEYIEDLYRLFLGRESDAVGKEDWVEFAASGVSRKYLARGFADSQEFSNLCATYHIAKGNLELTEVRDLHPMVASLVVSHYKSCLERVPSASEINYWTEKVISSYASALIYGVFHSSEYASKEKSNAEFAEDIYQAVLQREPDDGIQGWIEKLDQGEKKDIVLEGFMTSAEFEKFCEQSGIKSMEKHRFPRAVAVLNQVGWNLRAAYDWSSGMPYYGHTDDMPGTPENGNAWFANYGYDHYKGNCYVMAGTFYQMAVELGYKARQVYGRVPRRDGTYSTHSWVEIIINGTTYVFDPQFEGKTGRNGYYFTYGKSGTWRYIKDGTMATWK